MLVLQIIGLIILLGLFFLYLALVLFLATRQKDSTKNIEEISTEGVIQEEETDVSEKDTTNSGSN